jgi:hypothetical protein
MSAPCNCRKCFSERSRARAEARDAKTVGVFDRRRWPGKRFEMDALPAGLLLTREERSWSARRVIPPAPGGGS